MDNELIIYAKHDENNSIIDIRSNFFIDDTEGYEEIDRWGEGEDRYLYAHADNGEYIKEKHGKPLFDEKGIPNYHGEFVEWSEEAKKEKYPTLYNAKLIAQQEAELKAMMERTQRVSFLVELPDEEAVKIPYCYDEWQKDKLYKVGDRVQMDGKLWKCRQEHTSQENWKPSIETASLYERIDIEHAGTLEDPIPYDQTMTVYKGKYYIENEKIYKCIRDSGQPLYATCESLVGNYFELV